MKKGGWVPLLAVVLLFGGLCMAIVPGAFAASSEITYVVSYAVAGGGTGYGPPTFNFFQNGALLSIQLTTSTVAVSVDAGSTWSVTSQLPGGNSTVIWATGLTSGTANRLNSVPSVFVYYRQALINFGYSIIGGGKTVPLVNYYRFGNQESGKNAGTSVFVDIGSSFNYLPTVYSNTPGESWAAQVPLNATVTEPKSYTVAYYHQYLVTAQYSSSGGNLPQIPQLSGTALGIPTSIPLSSQSYSSIWLDAQSRYQVSAIYLGQNERWGANGMSGVLYSPLTLALDYHIQFSMNLGYNVIGGYSPGQPLLTYLAGGQQSIQPLPQTPAQIWGDGGTPYSVSSLLPGSSSTERWTLSGPSSGTLTGPIDASLTYYHQYAYQITYSAIGGGTLPTPSIGYTSMGASNITPLGQGTVWADSGSSVSVVSFEAGPVSGEGWALGTQIPTVANGPVITNANYYLQVQVQASYHIQGGGSPPGPSLAFTSLGILNSANLKPSGTIWIDDGTPWSVQTDIGGNSGERWALVGGGSSGQAGSPFVLDLSYQHQYQVQVSTGRYGGGRVSNSTGWYNQGQKIELSATPWSGWEFEGWAGGQNISSGTLGLTVNGPITVTAVFYPGITLVAGSGGSITYVSAPKIGVATNSVPVVAYVVPGSEVTLYGTPSNRLYQFLSWSGAATGNQNPITLTVTGPIGVRANFGISTVSYFALIGAITALAVGVYLGMRIYRKKMTKWITGFRGTGWRGWGTHGRIDAWKVLAWSKSSKK